MSTKAQLIDALKALGIEAPANASKETLQGMLDAAGGNGAPADETSPVIPPVTDGSGTPAPPPPEDPPEDEPSFFQTPEEEETYTFVVKGQPVCENGVTYKKGERIELTEARAMAIGSGLLEEDDD